MSHTYFIYSHISPSGKVYIGQTININRRWGHNGEHYLSKKKDGTFVQSIFARAILKYGWNNFEHKIILEGISKSEANYAEKYLIRWYKIHNLSYNISDGGEGTTGVRTPLTEERKAAIKIFMNTNHPMKGKKHTSEAMAKILYANRNRHYTQEQKQEMRERGKKLSQIPITEDRRRKYREYRKAHPETWIGGWNKKAVHQYDLEGNYIQSFSSADEAAKSVGRNSGADICKCINGECASAHGYIWRTEKIDFIELSNYKVVKTAHGARLIDLSEDKRLARSAAHGKAVNQYSLDGEYITTYCTVSEASRQTGINRSGINRCCRHEYRFKTAGGYLWEYDTIDNRIKKEVI